MHKVTIDGTTIEKMHGLPHCLTRKDVGALRNTLDKW